MSHNPIKVKLFADEYIANGYDAKKAMRKVSPNLTEGSVRVKAYRWIASPEVIDEIVSRIEALKLTPEKVKSLIYNRMLNIINSRRSKDSDSVQASHLLARIEKLTNDVISPTQVNIYQEIIREWETSDEENKNNLKGKLKLDEKSDLDDKMHLDDKN